MGKKKTPTLKRCYDEIIRILKEYVDLDEMYHPIIGCWAIGTYFHDQMLTYPYLYLNATKGGGKTRTMRLLSYVARNGTININPTNSTMFRKAQDKCAFFFDEMENIGAKEKANLRLLLNAAYKRGMKVPRSRKVTTKDGESFVVDEFEVFTPIAIANIWGLENVLEDRCITVILDKSYNNAIINKMELWEHDTRLNQALKDLISIREARIDPNDTDNIDSFFYSFAFLWNNLHKVSQVSLVSQESSQSQQSQQSQVSFDQMIANVDWSPEDNDLPVELTDEFYSLAKKVWESGISGRQLELFMPLILMAHEIDKKVEDSIIKSAIVMSDAKKEEEVANNRDNSFVAYLINNVSRETDRHSINEITNQFQNIEDSKWITPTWVGKALRRLKLVHRSGRNSTGRWAVLNWDKIDLKAFQMGLTDEHPHQSKLI